MWEEVTGLEERTILHIPLRSWSVRSGGAAIVGVCQKVRRNLMHGEQQEEVFGRGNAVLINW